MKKYIPPILAVVLAIGCYMLWSQSAHERMELLELRASAEAGSQREAKERADMEKLRSQLEGFRKAANVQASKSADSVATPGWGTRTNIDITPFLMRDPAYARIHRQIILNFIRRQYGDLKSLNLPADQEQKLENLLIDKNSVPRDTDEAAQQAGMNINSPEFTKAVGAAYKDVDDQIKALLGPSGYQQLQDAANESVDRMSIASSIGQSLALAGMPLSNDQLIALADARFKNQGQPTGANDDALATIFSQIMTPDQFALFSQNAALQKEQNDLVQRAAAAAKQQYGNSISWHYSSP
jgi:hypothetical protein